MRKTTFLTGFAAGYVLGARAGRERYEQIAKAAGSLASNPRVQQTTEKAKSTVTSQAASLASTAKERVTGSFGGSSSPSSSDLADDDLDEPFVVVEDSVMVVDINDGVGNPSNGHVGTGTGPTGTNDRMGL